MENEKNTNSENLISDENNNNSSFKRESLIINDNKEEEVEQNDDNIEDLHEEEYDLEKMKEPNNLRESNEEIDDNENNEEMLVINDNNDYENEEEQIIIENENENDNEDGEEEQQINEENNIEEMINEEKEENENSDDVNNNSKENLEEKELYKNDNEEENEKPDEKYDLPLDINNKDQNNNIKIEEYESELNEIKAEKNDEKNEEKNDEYILNKLAKLKKKNQLRANNKTKYQSNSTEDKINLNEIKEEKPIFPKKYKYIKLDQISPHYVDVTKDLKEKENENENKPFILRNIKYVINEEGNPVDITSKIYNGKIIAYIIPRKNKTEKNILVDTKGNRIPKTDEDNYIYMFKNEKDNTTKKILIKDFDVQNPELRINEIIPNQIKSNTNLKDIKTNNTTNNNYINLTKNIYNKSNDDIKRILNIDNNYNNKYTTENLLNYNNLMNIWRQRYGQKSRLYQKVNSDLDNNYKINSNDKMVKRTNSILKMNEHIYPGSFTDGNLDNNFINNYNSNFSLRKKYNIPIYYNGIINRKYYNPLLKKSASPLGNKKYNPLLYTRTHNNLLLKRNNFTDFLRAKLNNSSDFNNLNNNRNLSFERLNLKNDGKKFLYANNRYNYQGNNILKNNLYKSILQRNREKEISKSNDIDNGRNKNYSVINNNIYNTIRKINNNRKRDIKLRCSVLSLKANQLIKNFNSKYKKEKNFN